MKVLIYTQLFNSLSKAIEKFLEEIKKHNLQDLVTDKWTVKDVMCHIAFWHNYYAENYSALASGTEPFIFSSKGGSTRNQKGVDSLKYKSQKELKIMIDKAQKSLYKSIIVKQVPKMHYIGRREYNTEDFLEIVTSHIQRHEVQVKRAKKKLS